MLPQNTQSPLPWKQMGLGVEAMDQIVAQQVRRESQKNKDGNNRGEWQQQCLSLSNQVAIRKHKKA